jgi:hypothetical protein
MSKPILCLDFDGVCHAYNSGWKGAAVISDPCVPGMFEFLEEACKVFDIQVYSSRSHQEGGITAMQFWFAEQRRLWREGGGQGSEVLPITFPMEKPPAMVGLDDRVLTFNGKWPSVADLQAFQPWNKRAAAPEPPAPGVGEEGAQNWQGMDGAIAFHLIDRHAEGWNQVGEMMEAWRAANTPAPSAGVSVSEVEAACLAWAVSAGWNWAVAGDALRDDVRGHLSAALYAAAQVRANDSGVGK